MCDGEWVDVAGVALSAILEATDDPPRPWANAGGGLVASRLLRTLSAGPEEIIDKRHQLVDRR